MYLCQPAAFYQSALCRVQLTLAATMSELKTTDVMGDDAPIFWERKAKVAKFLTH